MDNDAFKDLVRKQAKVSSSKEIARKAVEEEFSKKKKRKRGGGGGYASSSEEDEDDDDDQKGNRGRKSKKEQQAAAEEEEKERAKAVEEDLAARYRDRAKERREGGVTTTASGGDSDKKESTSTMDFLIVPHNKKGLDLSLIQKEREGLRNRRHQQGAKPSYSDLQAPSDALEEIRSEMPTPEEAMKILEEFMDSSTSTPSASMFISHGVAEYVREFVKWTKETVEGRYDNVSCSHAGRNLQNTKLAFAIDGHPSDTVRAWQRPRQYTVASASSVLSPANTSMLSSEVMDGIGRVFAKRNRVLSDMKQQSANNATSASDMATASKGRDALSGRNVKIAQHFSQKAEELEEVDDDDIFGGLDDYVPPAPKAKS